jgi:hypothetical protein
MGRHLISTGFSLAIKIAVLMILTNLLFSFFEGHGIAWQNMLDVQAFGDKLVAVTRALLELLHGLLHAVLE